MPEELEGTVITEDKDLKLGGKSMDEMSLDELGAAINAMSAEETTPLDGADPEVIREPGTTTSVETATPTTDPGDAIKLKAEVDIWKKRFDDRQGTIDRQGQELGEVRAKLRKQDEDDLFKEINTPAPTAPTASATEEQPAPAPKTGGVNAEAIKKYIDSRLGDMTKTTDNMGNLMNFMTQYPSDWQSRLKLMEKLNATDPRVGRIMSVDPGAAFDYVMAKIDVIKLREGASVETTSDGRKANVQARLSAVISGHGGSTLDPAPAREPTAAELAGMSSKELEKLAPKDPRDPVLRRF